MAHDHRHDHAHPHAHDEAPVQPNHGHDAHDHRDAPEPRLWGVLLLQCSYLFAEAIAGWYSGSLALIADAGHMLSDVAALALTLFALRIARRPPDPQRTYGYAKAEILAATANAATLGALSLWILMEAAGRLACPEPLLGGVMTGVAVGGLVVNLAGLALLGGHHHDDLNVRGAFLHLASDALGSIGAIGAGVFAWQLGWMRADPIASILIALLILRVSWTLLAKGVHLLLDGVPEGIDLPKVRSAILTVPGVRRVHDLHIWAIGPRQPALSAHVEVEAPGAETLEALRSALAPLGIRHTTFQIEATPCGDTDDCDAPR